MALVTRMISMKQASLNFSLEQGFLSAICEAYGLLRTALELSNQEISDIFQTWTSKGELKGNYLLGIGFETLRFKKGDGDQNPEGIVDDVEDKVVQDVDNSEGTGVWTVKVIYTMLLKIITL